MAAPTAPTPHLPSGGLKGNPHQKRMLIALGGAAVLALIFMLQRRSAADPAATPAPAPTGTEAAQTPSTFADNGEQAAAMGNAVTDALQSQGDQVSGALLGVADALGQLKEGNGSSAVPAQPAAAPGPAGGQPNQPAGRAATGPHHAHRRPRTAKEARQAVAKERHDLQQARKTERRLERRQPPPTATHHAAPAVRHQPHLAKPKHRRK